MNDPNGKLSNILFYVDMVTTIVFSIEIILKVIAFGFLINGEYSYLRNISNVLDFFISVLSVIL